MQAPALWGRSADPGAGFRGKPSAPGGGGAHDDLADAVGALPVHAYGKPQAVLAHAQREFSNARLARPESAAALAAFQREALEFAEAVEIDLVDLPRHALQCLGRRLSGNPGIV